VAHLGHWGKVSEPDELPAGASPFPYSSGMSLNLIALIRFDGERICSPFGFLSDKTSAANPPLTGPPHSF